jgi:Domain of unknown function (DUF4382)
MRTSAGTIRNVIYLVIVLMLSAALAACGGGGGSSGSTSPGASGPVTVGVSVASATDYPAGTTFAVATASPVGTSAPPTPVSASDFSHVWVRVNRIALIPVDSIPYMERNKPNRDGELEEEDTAESNDNFVTVALVPPKTIDLLNPPSGAKILNRFPSVPAGEYGKIRVYYDSVVGERPIGDNVLFHPTAHYHFDVHFVGGNLVVPVSSDPSGGVRFFQVDIGVVGLKIHSAGNSGKVLLRPQVFATVDTAKYLVSGVAQNVNPGDNTFDIHTSGGTIVPAAYDENTGWMYFDKTVIPIKMSDLADLGARGLDNGAIVDVIGTFSSNNFLMAMEVDITFPDVLTGKVYLDWKGDNTFELRPPALPGDNTVFPMPTRATAYYDNVYDGTQLSDLKILDNAAITARGYKVAGGINAYWISIGDTVGP